MKKLLAIIICLAFLLAVFAGCGQTGKDGTSSSENTDKPSYPDYTLEREEGTNQLTFYWSAAGVDYSKCDIAFFISNPPLLE